MWPFSKKKETVEVELPDGKGGKVWKRINKDKFDRLLSDAVSKGQAEISTAAEVNILDLGSIVQERWLVGHDRDVTQEQFNHYNENGKLFVLCYYEEGHRKMGLVTKALYDLACRQMLEIERGSDVSFEETMQMLLKP